MRCISISNTGEPIRFPVRHPFNIILKNLLVPVPKSYKPSIKGCEVCIPGSGTINYSNKHISEKGQLAFQTDVYEFFHIKLSRHVKKCMLHTSLSKIGAINHFMDTYKINPNMKNIYCNPPKTIVGL